MPAYAGTTVTVSRSQEQIRKVLRAADVERVTFGEGWAGIPTAGVEFVHSDVKVRMVTPIAQPSDGEVAKRASRARTRNKDIIRREMVEAEERRVWRVLHWAIKSRMEAIAEGLETFEQAFLSAVVDPYTNTTLWETMRPAIEAGAFNLNGPGMRAIEQAS